ncbi:MAG: sigma factor-like helix-turn-helix DNA-binding protein [Ideonella sp.]|nr:sigma factor-like helix-turn-helix DNA-binding protein [Ideonella sp.]
MCARGLSELDAQDRDAIELCDLQGMAQTEFARRKGLSLSAVESRRQRARQRMGCQVSFDTCGRVDDFVPPPPLPDGSQPRPSA